MCIRDSDIAYHEGNRIDELRLAGTNIAEYAIEYPAEHNENMLYAISEMQRLIKKACCLLYTSRCV